MTDPNINPRTEPETDPQPEARTGHDGRSGRRFELSPAQVTGSALAAMTGAFLASYLGTAGTVIGAAVGSLIATVGTTAYTWWLRRTSEVVKRTATQVRETGMGSTVVIPLLPGKGKAGSRTTSEPGGDTEPELETEVRSGSGSGDGSGPGDGSGGDGDEPDRWAWARGRPWGKLALVAAAIALVVLGGLTVLEGITGKPLSSYTRGGHQTGTSVGHLVGNNPSPTPKPTKPGTTVTPTPTPTPTPSPTLSPLTPTPLSTPTPTSTGLPTDSTAPTPTPSIGVTPTP